MNTKRIVLMKGMQKNMKLFLSIIALIGFLVNPASALIIPGCDPGIEHSDNYMALKDDRWIVRINGKEWNLKYLWVEEAFPSEIHESWILTGADSEGQTVQFWLVQVSGDELRHILYSGHLQVRPDEDKFIIEDGAVISPCI